MLAYAQTWDFSPGLHRWMRSASHSRELARVEHQRLAPYSQSVDIPLL